MNDAMRGLIDEINTNKNALWVFCGDSITHGALHTEGRRDYVELVAERVRFEMGRKMNLFVNTGISGDSTRGILATLEHRALRFQPDFFSLMIGMNDCACMPEMEFSENLDRIIEGVRAGSKAHVLLQTCCAIDPALNPNRAKYPAFMEVVRRKAEQHKTALIDHHAMWEETRLKEPKLWASWMSDVIHPGGLGHWIFAERILTELGLGPLEHTKRPA